MSLVLATLDKYSDSVFYGPDVSISWPAIAAGVIAAMVIGSVWYGPLFGERWMKLVKLTKKDTENNWQKPMAAMLLLSIVQSFVLAHFINYAAYFYPDFSDWKVGVITGFWAWVGFVLPVLAGNYMFARRSMELLKIDLGNYFVTLLAVGAIIAALS